MKIATFSALCGLSLSVVGCASASKETPRSYEVDGHAYCALHRELLIGLKLPIKYGHRFGVVDPLKKENYPNYTPWLNGGDLLRDSDPQESIAIVCLSCKRRYEVLHPTKNEPNQSSEPTPTSVTTPAAQEIAPAAVVAHL